MKKIIFFCAFIFLLISTVSAISTDLKSSYEKSETIIIEITGNILEPISNSQIEFMRGHVAIPLAYESKKLSGKYYLWIIAPQQENNYTLLIKDITTTVAGRTEKIDFAQNFSVSQNSTDYFIKPGLISTQKDFSIDIYLNEDSNTNISINFPIEREVILKPGKNTLDFSLDNISATTFTKINIGKYSLPAYIIKVEDEKAKLRIEPNTIISTAYFKDVLIYPFQLVNFGDKRLDVKLEYNKDIFSLSQDNLISLKENSFVELNLTIKELTDETKKGINEKISFVVDNQKFELPVIISFTENKSEASTPYIEGSIVYYCTELNGKVCSGGEVCNGEVKPSIDGACCIGECKSEEAKDNSWIGYLIAGLLVIVVIYIFIRYRKTKTMKEGFSKEISKAEKLP
ncbi:MAG: hypothetical protein AABX83_02610 [Nanoarchaeota archaeon]